MMNLLALVAAALTTVGAFTSRDVEFDANGLHYAGTLTIPEGVCRCPAVVIASGTYPQDRDGTMAGHKVFKEMAEFLSERGIAVLRVDDRGVGGSTGVYEDATTADFADDVIAAVEYLKTRPGIARRKIGVLGHSEGGASCSIAASRCKDIRFMVTASGLMSPGLESVIRQNKDIVENTPIPDRDKRRYDEINDIMFHTAYEYAEADSATLSSALFAAYDEWKKRDDARIAALGIQFDHFRYFIHRYVQQANTLWYRFFIRYNPGDYLSNVNIPVLAVNGTKDVMVNCDRSLADVKKYLAHNKNVTVVPLEGLNHLLLPCEKGTQDEYASITEPVSRDALMIICAWILHVCARS